MAEHKIAVIGIGKIAEDQHLPVIAKNPSFELAAVVSGSGKTAGGVPTFRKAAELYAAMPEVHVVAICTPPSVRHAFVREAIEAGKHVLMEKPPTQTIAEYDDLIRFAEVKSRVLFSTWHSQYNAAVDRVRAMLKQGGVKSVRIDWREDVRKWHPGQDWVWQPGGFGVCDPGINAMSIFTRIMPEPVFVQSSVMTFPENRETPIAVEVVFKTSAGDNGPKLTAGFDWREQSGEIWTFTIETANGLSLKLEGGGRRLLVDGQVEVDEPSEEYERIYERFAVLLRDGVSDNDVSPFRLMADIFFAARREVTEPFNW